MSRDRQMQKGSKGSVDFTGHAMQQGQQGQLISCVLCTLPCSSSKLTLNSVPRQVSKRKGRLVKIVSAAVFTSQVREVKRRVTGSIFTCRRCFGSADCSLIIGISRLGWNQQIFIPARIIHFPAISQSN